MESVYIFVSEAHPSLVKRARAAVDAEHLYGMAKRGGRQQLTLEKLGPRGRRERAAELRVRAYERKKYGTNTAYMPSAFVQNRLDRNLARQQVWAQRAAAAVPRVATGPETKARLQQERDRINVKLERERVAQQLANDLEAWRQAGSVGPMPTLDAGKQLSLGTELVNVRAHTRTVGGKEVPVRAYTRANKEKEDILSNGTLNNYVVKKNRTEIYEVDASLNGKVVKCMWKPLTGEGLDQAQRENSVNGNMEGNPRNNIHNGTGYLREVAGYQVGALLGLDKYLPVAAIRDGKAKAGDHIKGVLIEFVNSGLEEASKYDEWGGGGGFFGGLFGPPKLVTASPVRLKALENLEKSKDLGKLAAYDYILGNEDGHDSNWLISKDSKRIKILDHGLAFPENNDWGIRSRFFDAAYKKGLNIKDSIGDSWDNKWSEVYALLTTVGIDSKSIEATRLRYEELITAKSLGKSFFDLTVKRRQWPNTVGEPGYRTIKKPHIPKPKTPSYIAYQDKLNAWRKAGRIGPRPVGPIMKGG